MKIHQCSDRADLTPDRTGRGAQVARDDHKLATRLPIFRRMMAQERAVLRFSGHRRRGHSSFEVTGEPQSAPGQARAGESLEAVVLGAWANRGQGGDYAEDFQRRHARQRHARQGQMRSLTALACLAMMCACASSDDDDAPAAANEARPTFESQVERGQQLYAAHCAGCHGDNGQGTGTAPRVVGLDQGALPLEPPPERKVRKEDFVTVADVANFVVAYMPADEPGSLETDEYLAILAFDLKANGITLEQPLDLELAETLTIPR